MENMMKFTVREESFNEFTDKHTNYDSRQLVTQGVKNIFGGKDILINKDSYKEEKVFEFIEESSRCPAPGYMIIDRYTYSRQEYDDVYDKLLLTNFETKAYPK